MLWSYFLCMSLGHCDTTMDIKTLFSENVKNTPSVCVCMMGEGALVMVYMWKSKDIMESFSPSACT